METISLATLPSELGWRRAPQAWQQTGDNAITITGGPATDLFNNPQGDPPIDTAPQLLFEPQGDFTLQATVRVDFAATYDAGVLLIYADPDHWAKLCFELSPQGKPTLVSVVTQTYSDDCNAQTLDGDAIHLRVARMGEAYAFHYSSDGGFWHLLRLFRLDPAHTYAVGFSAQSPSGDTCTASFSGITYAARRLDDVRSGE